MASKIRPDFPRALSARALPLCRKVYVARGQLIDRKNETYSAVSSHAAAAYAASALLTLLSRNLKIGFSTK